MLPCGAVTTQAMTLSERADACLAALDEAGQAIARRVFLRLVHLGEGQADTSRPQPLSALRASDDPERVAAILRRLADARLLTIDVGEISGEPRVELAHEALIASWPALQGWIRAHGKAEQLRRQLETDATQWRRRASQGLGEVGLLDNGQLSEIAAGLTADTRRALGVSEVAEAFIAASRAAAARRRWWPWKTSAGSFLAVLLILLILATPVTLLSIVGLIAALIHRFE